MSSYVVPSTRSEANQQDASSSVSGLSAAEQAKAHISSLDRVAATGHACANMRSQENQQDASEPVSD